jgi:hypothetical protein
MSEIAQYTTLIPVDLDAQLDKLEGWHKAHGGPVHTVNHSREYAVLAPQLPDWVIPVEIRFAQKFGRDYVPLRSLLAAIRRSCPAQATRIVLANSDIEIARAQAIDTLRDPGCDLLFASREDIDTEGRAAGLYRQGYDVFSLSPDALELLDLKGVFLGLPWWDYVLPLCSVLTGRSVRRLDTDAFTHRIHPQRWSLTGFNYIGWQVMRQILPGEMCNGEPSADEVMEFAKVANSFLNSDVFREDSPPDPAQIKAGFLAIVAQETGMRIDDRGSAAAQIEMIAGFAEMHGAMYGLYREAIEHPETPGLADRLAGLEAQAHAAGLAGQESFGRYTKLIGLRLRQHA